MVWGSRCWRRSWSEPSQPHGDALRGGRVRHVAISCHPSTVTSDDMQRQHLVAISCCCGVVGVLWTESPGRWGLVCWRFLTGTGTCKGPRRAKLRGFEAVLGRLSATLEGENTSCVSSEPDSAFECHFETRRCSNAYEKWLFP